MIAQTQKIFRYELHNLMRSKWVLFIGLFFLLATEALFRFGSDSSKVMISLMNIILLVVPLMSLILGIIYFYQSREFVELLLAQPIKRSSIFLGKVMGLSLSLSLVFVAGMGIPFLLHAFDPTNQWMDFLAILFVGCMLILIFVAISFMIATIHEDKIKGFGTAVLLWLYLSVIYDAIILVAVYALREYPLEKPLIGLIMLNPVDLGRLVILLRLDIAALMGYTGAVFRQFFGSGLGMGLSVVALMLWLGLPLSIGMHRFHRKDF